MKRFFGKYFFVISALSLCPGAIMAQPRLSLSANRLEFGNIHYLSATPVKEKKVTIYNLGYDTLRISKVTANEVAGTIYLESSLIAPRDSTKLRISCAHPEFTPDGQFERMVTIQSNDPQKQHQVHCTGFMTPLDFYFDMSDTTLASVTTHSASRAYLRTFYLENRSDSTLTIDSIYHANGCRIMPPANVFPPRSRMKFQALIKPSQEQNIYSWHNKIFFEGMSYESVHIRFSSPDGKKKDRKNDCKKRSVKTLSS